MWLGSLTLLQAEGERAREGGVAEQDEDGVMWRTRHLENKQMKMNAWAPRYSRQTARAAQTNNLSAASISYCVTCTRLNQCKPFVFQKMYFFLMSIKQNALNWSVDHSPPVSVQEEVNDQQRELFASLRLSRAVLHLNANEIPDDNWIICRYKFIIQINRCNKWCYADKGFINAHNVVICTRVVAFLWNSNIYVFYLRHCLFHFCFFLNGGNPLMNGP